MNMFDILFAISVLGMLGITIAKVYNLFNGCRWYDNKKGFILFIAFVFLWFIGLMVVIATPLEATETGASTDVDGEVYKNVAFTTSLFQFANVFLVLNFLFLVVELLFNAGTFTSDYVTKYRPNR